MRVVLQRVARAEVRVAGESVGAIERGFLLLVGVERGDRPEDRLWMAKKIAGLRLFPDEAGAMNRDLAAVEGRVLAVSQFTLLGDASKGRRPSFVRAEAPELAAPAFEAFVQQLGQLVGPVETGRFGANMQVELLNDGPVTLLLERGPRPTP